MSDEQTRQSFGYFLGKEKLQRLVEKRGSAEYLVSYLDYLWQVSFWVFIKAAALGRLMSNNPFPLGSILGTPGNERKLVQGIKEMGDNLAKEQGCSEGLYEVWASTLPRQVDIKNYKKWGTLRDTKIKFATALYDLESITGLGIGLGLSHPEDVRGMWMREFKRVDAQSWESARAHGLDIPKIPEALDLTEIEEIVLEETKEYCRQFMPQILGDIHV